MREHQHITKALAALSAGALLLAGCGAAGEPAPQAPAGPQAIEVQTTIADGLEVPLEEVYGVVTFYAQFSLYPKGQYKISVCLGTACYVKGSGDIYDRLQQVLGISGGECTPDGKFSLEACRCIGPCGLAPVMTINEDVYGKITPDDVKDILAKYA